MVCIIWIIVAKWGLKALMKVSILLRWIITATTAQVSVIVVSGSTSSWFMLMWLLM